MFVYKALSDTLNRCHQLCVVHRDLKSANVLLDQQGKSHLVDFGLAKFSLDGFNENHITALLQGPRLSQQTIEYSPIKTNTIGTLIYRAPE